MEKLLELNFYDPINFYTIRLINVLVIGSCLAISGKFLQKVTGNILADPYLIGIAPATFLGYLLSYLINYPNKSGFVPSIVAIVTSLIVSLLIVRFTRVWKTWLILFGILFGGLCLSLSNLILFLKPRLLPGGYSKVFGLTMLDNWNPTVLLFILGLTVISILVGDILLIKRNALLDHDIAKNKNLIGNNILITYLLLVLASTLAALSTIEFGIVGFVGFMVPNFVRILFGPSFKAATLFTGLLGAALLLLSDWLGRLINPPYGVPVAVVISLLGLPILFILALKHRTVL